MGGDEFVIVLSEVLTKDGGIRVAKAILRDICSITELGGHPVQISASIGISSVLAGAGASQHPDLLLSQADAAMYVAKQKGKDCYCFSEPTAWEAGEGPTGDVSRLEGVIPLKTGGRRADSRESPEAKGA
jgi:predicted signal transduction protein with EAL and GGDEF domain